MSALDGEDGAMPDDEDRTRVAKKNGRTLVGLLSVVVLMVVFGFFLMPLAYGFVCDLVGVGYNPQNDSDGRDEATGRHVTVYFGAKQPPPELPVTFWPDREKMNVEVGMYASNSYTFRNNSDDPVYLRPQHFVTPEQAGANYEMLVCFCFKDMKLEPNEERSFDLEFRFQPAMSPRVRTVDVRYSLLKIDAEDMRAVAEGVE